MGENYYQTSDAILSRYYDAFIYCSNSTIAHSVQLLALSADRMSNTLLLLHI